MPPTPLLQGKPLDVLRAVQQALQPDHQGRTAKAELLYDAVLAVRPDNIDALQMQDVSSCRVASKDTFLHF
jgi:hypothetical protein